jgi:hypothetical protein
MPWIRNDIRQDATPRVSDSRKYVWVALSNISVCRHMLICRCKLLPCGGRCMGKKTAVVLLYIPLWPWTDGVVVVEDCVLWTFVWFLEMQDVRNYKKLRNILLENLWEGSVIWRWRQAMRVFVRFALCEIEMWAVLNRTELGVQTEVMRLCCVTNEKWHDMKVHPRAGVEGQQRKKSYSCILKPRCSMGVCGNLHAPAALPTGRRRGTHCGAWVGPRAGLDGCGKFRRYRDSIPGPYVRPASSYTDWSILAEIRVFCFKVCEPCKARGFF